MTFKWKQNLQDLYLYLLKRVKDFTSPNSIIKLFFFLFYSHLLYCTNILCCTSQTNLTKISTQGSIKWKTLPPILRGKKIKRLKGKKKIDIGKGERKGRKEEKEEKRTEKKNMPGGD
jgi:hypothetical protein